MNTAFLFVSQLATELHDSMASLATLYKEGLCSKLERARVERDLAISKAAEATKECEAAKEKACHEGGRALFVEEENRLLQAKIKAMEMWL